MPEQKDDLLESRYGQKQPRPGRFRWLAYLGVAAMTIGVVALGLANWSPVQATTVSFRVVSPWVTEVEFEIQMPPGSVAECELQALNNAFAVVGYVKQTFGPFDRLINNQEIAIKTYEEAVTGLVDSCTLR
jgi:hypothetical protein